VATDFGLCCLDEAQRRETFIVFQSYSAFCKEHSYWDDCDRVLELISHLNYTVGNSGWGGGGKREQEAEIVGEDEAADLLPPAPPQQHTAAAAQEEEGDRLLYSKIYVDEVQDLTQAEIAMLFMLSDSRSLFLAGDTLWNSGFGARGAGPVVFPVSRRCQ